MVKFLCTIIFATLMASCAGSRVSSIPVSSKPSAPVKVIALDPGGGLLADAVGIELANRGFTVLDPASTSRLMVRLNIDEIEVNTPIGLEKLKGKGVDAYLTVRTAAGRDGKTQSASVRVNSTDTKKIIAGLTWENGWGGRSGSIADRAMHKGLPEAASEIVDNLVQSIKPE
ncbi:hypothetical protein [Geobacter pickeringii]|uniref:hypothetical protein n=1 Tax=Geobacter pickeringii TaxID=345632 RepID=UPI001F2BBF67|nr:hypothetical protein [Geobacter pickeringii]